MYVRQITQTTQKLPPYRLPNASTEGQPLNLSLFFVGAEIITQTQRFNFRAPPYRLDYVVIE